MLRTRIEVNDTGDFYTIIPDDVIEEYGFQEGDELDWDIDDEDYVIISHA